MSGAKRMVVGKRQASRLVACAKGPELGIPVGCATEGIVSTPTVFRSPPASRAFDLLQKLEPDFEKGRAPLAGSRRCFAGMFKPSLHGTPE
jgi:hypothetical protein